MSKSKPHKEVIGKSAAMLLAYNYDLARIDVREYAAPLGTLFHSQAWKDIFTRRNVLARAATTGAYAAFKQMEEIDRKVASMILHAMFDYYRVREKQIDGKTINLREFFNDFVRTPEQKELYEQFSLDVNSSVALVDVLESMLIDAKSTLRQLDPALVLGEFDNVKQALKPLQDFSFLSHRDEHDKLSALFADYAEEVEEYLRMKTSLFVHEYTELRQALVNSGEMQSKNKKKHSDKEYLTELLANYFYIMSPAVTEDEESRKRVDIHKKAEKAINAFSKDEYEELMPVVLELYKQASTIHMAHDAINLLLKNLPETELTKKILKYIQE